MSPHEEARVYSETVVQDTEAINEEDPEFETLVRRRQAEEGGILTKRKTEFVFFFQVTILFLVVGASLVNLTLENGSSRLWVALLGTCLGYALPNPTIIKDENKSGISSNIYGKWSQKRASILWRFFGYRVPRPEIVFACQFLILIAVVSVALYNLVQETGDSKVWVMLISSCLGAILPSPTIGDRKHS